MNGCLLRVCACVAILFLLSSCNVPLLQKDPEPNNPPAVGANLRQSHEQQAQQLIVSGDYQGAANHYWTFASQTQPPRQQHLQLKAVTTLLRGQLLPQAKAYLEQIQIPANHTELQQHTELVNIHILLAERQIAVANQRLSALNVNTLPRYLQADYHTLSVISLEQEDRLWDAVQARTQLEAWLRGDAAALAHNRQSLWRLLNQISVTQLDTTPRRAGDVLSGWVELSILSRRASPSRLQSMLEQWQQRYPNHPARYNIARSLVQNLRPIDLNKKHIALLLPLTSQFHAEAKAFRDGFTAAWYADNNSVKPKIDVYDVNPTNVLQTYQKVVESGTDYVVGPLQKDSVAALTQARSSLPLLTLALNYDNNQSFVNNLYQFSLSPEDEAAVVAKRAWADGHRSAAILVPDSPWGNRIYTAYQQAWTRLGGAVVLSGRFNKSFRTISDAVKPIINAKESINVVLLGASPESARQIRPFFRYYFAQNLPMYSVSQVFRNAAALPQLDKDLNGIVFADMPWVLSPNRQAQQLQVTLQQYWSKSLERHKRLYAFGIDAYHLLRELPNLQNQPQHRYEGQTGTLALNNLHQIRRVGLQWAMFQEGTPVLLQNIMPNQLSTYMPR